tara:strand:+ start:1209 stop:1883 length:675 start_codon:yes stop_codon:yes gene_type:complete
MTINKPDIRILENEHYKTTMAELKKLLDNKNMTQADLALALKRDKTTINRWSKNSREITWDNAVKISQVLNCHPVEVWQPRQEIILDRYINNKFEVQMLKKEDHYLIPIPFEFYKTEVRAVQVDIPGNFLHDEIFLFDIPKKPAARFSKFSIPNLCYITFVKGWKKTTKKNQEIIGVVRSHDDGTMEIINPLTRKPINENFAKMNIKDIDICVPVKAQYNPDLL